MSRGPRIIGHVTDVGSCYHAGMLRPEELARARELAAKAKRDPLGLGVGYESALAMADAAAHRFFREGPSLERLRTWEAVVSEIRQRDGLPQSALEQLQSHEHLIGAFHECLSAQIPSTRFHEVVQRSLLGLSIENAIRIAARMTSLAVGIAETVGHERQVARPDDALDSIKEEAR
jgi:hypothetical protein